MKKLLLPLLLGSLSSANASQLLVETFDPISASNWNISGGVVEGTGNSEFFNGNALRFNDSGLRSANTVGYDLSTGGNISFRLKIGGPNDTTLFEDADSGEDIAFNYSIDNGSSWVNLFIFDTENTLYRDTWGVASFNIVGAAISGSTLFQWEQVDHSGTTFDNWAIDNVSINNNISSVPVPAAVWLFGSGLMGLIGVRKKSKLSAFSA